MIILIILFIAILIFLFGSSKKLEIKEVTIGSDKVKSPIRFALVSDLHSCFYGNDMEELIDPIKKAKVDFILNVGDMFDTRCDLKNSYTYFTNTKDIPSFYTSGNHELNKRRDLTYKKFLRENNIRVLEGQVEKMNIRGTNINIAGLDDIQIGLTIEKQISEVIQKKDDDFTILMSHRPHRFDIFSRVGADLTLSGHAHGGQWLIPIINRGLFAPDQGLFAKYASGLFKLENTTLYVGKGLARESVRIPRLFNRPELAIITIQSFSTQ